MMEILELASLRPVLGDGAMGTMLQTYGLKPGEPPEVWNLSTPEVVRQIHRAYADAGADFVETNTFGANRIKLDRYDLSPKLPELIKRAVDCAREAVQDRCLIAASIGPTGALLEPYGDIPADVVEEAFGEVASIFEGEGIDFFIVETMTDVREAECAIKAIKQCSKKPIAATIVFSKTPKGYRTLMGTSPDEAARRLASCGANLIGTNCCNGIAEAIEITALLHKSVDNFIVAQPNAGLPQSTPEGLRYPESPETMAEALDRLLEAGATVVGGCCGTTPHHIRAMAEFLGKC